MKILAISTSHNASICQITDGKIDFYLEEDRFNKIKNYHPRADGDIEFLSIKKYATGNYDKVIFASYDRRLRFASDGDITKDRDKIVNDKIFQQISGNPEYHFYREHHHLYHAHCGFHFSNFDEALCIVMDGSGAQPYFSHKPYYTEIESFYYLNKSKKDSKPLYQHLSNAKWAREPQDFVRPQYEIIDGVDVCFSSEISSGAKFSILTTDIGLGSGSEAGKTMGLSSYGNETGTRPEDLAKQLQISTKKDTIKLIKKAISYTNCKNIVLSGGYALNCVNNYEYVKEFPDYNFFVDPVAHDGGTSIGAAMWLYKND